MGSIGALGPEENLYLVGYGKEDFFPAATTWVVQDLILTAPYSSHCRVHVSLPTRQVGFGLRLDLQSFVHWYAIEGRDFLGQFPVSSDLTWVDRLFFRL
jgi:hypothetical protein